MVKKSIGTDGLSLDEQYPTVVDPEPIEIIQNRMYEIDENPRTDRSSLLYIKNQMDNAARLKNAMNHVPKKMILSPETGRSSDFARNNRFK
jgi:hypothetical protein